MNYIQGKFDDHKASELLTILNRWWLVHNQLQWGYFVFVNHRDNATSSGRVTDATASSHVLKFKNQLT